VRTSPSTLAAAMQIGSPGGDVGEARARFITREEM